jgi:catechol 2,3-dioxygenase-like lactoylglutathione lyase family enzyme
MAGKLRHIAMSVPDPWKAAEFYKHVFGMEVVGESTGVLADGVFLTDGVINIALLHFRTDETAQGKGRDYVGLHHVGFWVDDVKETEARLAAAGGSFLMGEPATAADGFYEIKWQDPNGVILDVTHNGWQGAQKNPGAEDNRQGPVTRRLEPQFDARREAAEAEFAKIAGE